MALRIKLLGNPQLWDDQTPVKLPSRRYSVALLGFLLLRRGQVFSRSHVAFTLWPDEEEDAARSELRRYLYQLRKALPPETGGVPWLLVDDESVAWNADAPCDLDTERFVRCCDDPARLREAVELYDGELLAEIYEDWAVAERERLSARYFAALAELIVQCRSRRAFGDALAFAQRLRSADPWREDTVRTIMTLRYEAGDAAGALAEFERFARGLRTEMNVEPMPETAALREAIVHGAPVGTLTVAGETSAERAGFAIPFVGRDDQFLQARAQWLRAARGRGSLVMISGEAGIGKTRLVGELEIAVASEGGRVLVGTTGSPEHRPYQAIVDALRSALPLVAALTLPLPIMAAVAELLPELRARRPDLPIVERLGGDAERMRLFDALAQVFVALARPRPLLVILEDLHWAGAVTIEALIYLVHRIETAAVLFVATARDEERSGRHAFRTLERALLGTPLLSRMALGPLDRTSVARLVADVAPGHASDPAFTDLAYGRSEGNPLFLVELLRDAADGGSTHVLVPSSVRAVVAERAARLQPRTRDIAEIAAIAGTAFTIDVLCAVAGVPEVEAMSAIDELLDRHLVRESTPRSRYDYTFTHQLIALALYETIEPELRERRHRRVARVLEELDGDDAGDRAAEIAFHFERAGEPLAAAHAFVRAARRAADIFANVEAADLATRGLALHAERDALRFELLRIRIEVAKLAGSATSDMAELAELQRVAGDVGGETMFVALAQYAGVAQNREDRVAEADAIQKLEHHGNAFNDDRALALALESKAHRALSLSDPAQAKRFASDAEIMHARLGDVGGRVRSLSMAAAADTALGNPGDAERLADRACELADAAGDARLRVGALRMQGLAALSRQDNARFEKVARATLELAKFTGDRHAEAHAYYQMGSADWNAWRIADGVRNLRTSIDLFEALGSPRVAASLNNLGGFLIDLGDFAMAREVLDRSFAAARADERDEIGNHVSLNLAEMAWLTGDYEALETHVAAARTYTARLKVPRHEAMTLVAAGRADRCAGRSAQALVALDGALARYESMRRVRDVVDVLYEKVLTLLAAQDVEGARAVASAASTLTRDHALAGDLQYPIRNHWVVACLQHAAGDAPATNAALSDAYRMYDARESSIADQHLRDAFGGIPYHRAMLRVRAGKAWPTFVPCAVAMVPLPQKLHA